MQRKYRNVALILFAFAIFGFGIHVSFQFMFPINSMERRPWETSFEAGERYVRSHNIVLDGLIHKFEQFLSVVIEQKPLREEHFLNSDLSDRIDLSGFFLSRTGTQINDRERAFLERLASEIERDATRRVNTLKIETEARIERVFESAWRPNYNDLSFIFSRSKNIRQFIDTVIPQLDGLVQSIHTKLLSSIPGFRGMNASRDELRALNETQRNLLREIISAEANLFLQNKYRLDQSRQVQWQATSVAHRVITSEIFHALSGERLTNIDLDHRLVAFGYLPAVGWSRVDTLRNKIRSVQAGIATQ